jgi:hypothetical protein
MNEKYDRLSSGLADRLAAAPPRGRAVVDDWHERTATDLPDRRPDAPRVVTAPSWPSVATGPRDAPQETSGVGRSEDEVRRAHLVPARLHGRARRRKVELANGHRLTWNDVLVDGVERLLHCDDALPVLEAALAEGQPDRLVQAMLPISLDRRFAALHIDLNESSDRRVTLEMLWSGAILLWTVADEPELR